MRREQCFSLGLALLASCSGPSKDARPDFDTTKPILAAPSPPPGDTSCIADGLWARCSAIKAIYRMGLNTHEDSLKVIEEKPLAIEGFELPIARGHVRFFLYADSNSRKRDQAKLDTAYFVPPSKDANMRRRTLVASANLLVLMDVMNTLYRERIANALMAGPPQPPSRKP